MEHIDEEPNTDGGQKERVVLDSASQKWTRLMWLLIVLPLFNRPAQTLAFSERGQTKEGLKNAEKRNCSELSQAYMA